MLSIEQSKKAARTYLEAGIPVFMWGKPGIGKTDSIYQLGEDTERPVFLFTSNIREPVDLRGLPTIDRDKSGKATRARWLNPPDLPDAERDGEEGILFLDDVLTAPPAMQAPLFGLALTGTIGDYTLPPGWWVIAASNYTTDKAGVTRINQALANRFGHIEVAPTVDDFTAWANSADIAPEVIAFIRYRPNLLHDSEHPDVTGAFPSPRQWAKAAKVIEAPAAKSDSKLRLALTRGLVGEGAATEFEGFLRIYESIPSLDAILINPRGHKTPTDVAALYAVASGLARRCDARTFENALAYMSDCPKEFEAMFVIDASKRNPKLTHTKAFAKWTCDNQSVLL